MLSKKAIQRSVLAALMLLSATSIGCVNKIVLYPIKGTDFCTKEDPECKMADMDYGMSEFYLQEVLKAKIDAK